MSDDAASKFDASELDSESLRFYLWMLADKSLPTYIKQKVAPSDIVQQTFLEAHRDLENFQGSSQADLRAWLRAILLNNAQNAIRQLHTLKRDVSRELSLDVVPDQTAELKSPSALAAFEEEFRILESALAALPQEFRDAIEYRSLRRWTFAQVGQKLGKGEDAARKTWFRAVKFLKEQMGMLK